MIRKFLLMAMLLISVQGGATEESRIKSLLNGYQQAQTNSTDSFVYATLISIHRALNKGENNVTAGLSNIELKALDAAERESGSLIRMTKELETKLTPSDVAAITKDNPESIYRAVGKFRIANSPSECTTEKYETLKRQVDLAELYHRGPHVGAFLIASELPFSTQYFQALSALVTKDKRFKEYLPLVGTVFSTKASNLIMEKSGLSAMASAFPSSDKARIKRYEENLIKEGVERSEVKRYAANMALLSPECLGTINMHFIKAIRRDFTVGQLNKFSQRLSGVDIYMADVPDGLDKFVDEKDPYLRTASDPWGSRIKILKSGPDKIVLVSQAEDQKVTSDDIRSAPISVHFKK